MIIERENTLQYGGYNTETRCGYNTKYPKKNLVL